MTTTRKRACLPDEYQLILNTRLAMLRGVITVTAIGVYKYKTANMERIVWLGCTFMECGLASK